MATAAETLSAYLGIARVGYAEVDADGWATVERDTALEELTDSWCHLLAASS